MNMVAEKEKTHGVEAVTEQGKSHKVEIGKMPILNLVGVPRMSELRKSHEGQYNICPGAEGMIKRLRVAPVRGSNGVIAALAEIVAMKMSDLDLPFGGTFHEAYVNGLAKGLRLCPGFFALLLSKEYDRKGAEKLYLAMAAVEHEPYSSVFVLEHDFHRAGNGKSLSSSYSDHKRDRHHDPTRLVGDDILLFWREPQK